MASISNLVNRFLDWCDKFGKDAFRYRKIPNTPTAHMPPRDARKKAVKIIDEKLFGIGKKK